MAYWSNPSHGRMVSNDLSPINSAIFTMTTVIPLKNVDTSRTRLRGLSKMDTCRNMCAGKKKARVTGSYQKKEDDKAKETKVSSPEPFSKEGAKYASGSRLEINDPLARGLSA
ncbi:UNVERIFIED_CONTAM: hypothetical protein Slati_2724900 [Sesamum latifolium]|uniref:Uncharacterized protein n=1 Tax=Sesamum latifolium TaxID=2727402 RepID=A0AAW2VZL4_9LAMI